NLTFPIGIVKTVRPGEVFGETCVFFNTPQVFTAKTREWSHLLRLDRVKLMSILQGCPNDTSHMISGHIQDLSANNNNPYMNVVLDFENRARLGRIDLPVSLWFAVGRGYGLLFDLLVEKYLDANERDNLGRTAMHLAASSGDVAKVNKLFEIGADPNLKVQALKDKGVTLQGCHFGLYACTAVERGNMDLLQTIGNMDLLHLSLPNDDGQTALHVAMVRDNFPMVQYLVESGVRIDQNDIDGNSPYGLAQIHGSEEIVNYLELRARLLPQII
ncbi:potassium channel AKT1-like, partial [Trifolium medium]|nr:potassium channel AKT1-like [Trifolium medium]